SCCSARSTTPTSRPRYAMPMCSTRKSPMQWSGVKSHTLCHTQSAGGIETRAWSLRARRLAPAIAERAECLDLVERRVMQLELVPDTPDRRSHIRSVTMLAAPSTEPHVMHGVIDLSVGKERTDIRGEKMDNLELAHGQVDIGLVPIDAAGGRAQ